MATKPAQNIAELYLSYLGVTNREDGSGPHPVAAAVLTLAEIVQSSAVGTSETLQNIVQAAFTNPTGFGR
jgi:hypothetical protein